MPLLTLEPGICKYQYIGSSAVVEAPKNVLTRMSRLVNPWITCSTYSRRDSTLPLIRVSSRMTSLPDTLNLEQPFLLHSGKVAHRATPSDGFNWAATSQDVLYECGNNTINIHYVNDIDIYDVLQVLRSLLIEQVLASGYTLFHAGALLDNGHLSLVFGEKGAGKTTTVLALALEGMQFVTNDKCLLSNSCYCWGIPQAIGVSDWTIRQFGTRLRPGSARTHNGKLWIYPAEFASNVLNPATGGDPQSILNVRISTVSDLVISRMDKSETSKLLVSAMTFSNGVHAEWVRHALNSRTPGVEHSDLLDVVSLPAISVLWNPWDRRQCRKLIDVINQSN